MRYLLDTNACITHLRAKGRSRASARIRWAAPGEIAVSSIVREELIFGAYRSIHVHANLQQVLSLLTAFRPLPFDDAAADRAAQVRATLEQAGLRIGYSDVLIAATALVHGLILVTHNVGEFSRVPGLTIEDWEVTP